MLWFKSRRLITFVFLIGKKVREAVGESFLYQFLIHKAHPENLSNGSIEACIRPQCILA
jgi:hypothetical protein